MSILAIKGLSILFFTCTGGCSAPATTDAGLAVASVVVTDSACRTLVFTMGDGSTPASVSLPNPASCGSGFILPSPTGTTEGRMSNPRRIYIRIRYWNRSLEPVILPVRLLLRRSGIVIIGSGTPAAVTASNADTLRSDSSAVWLIGGTGTLAVGDSTAVYEPIFKVDEPVQSARLTFDVLAESPNQVPAVAPDSTPKWFRDDSSWVSGHMRRVLDVRFAPGTSAAQKSAALDSVGAIVVGGAHMTQDSLGTYFIYMPGIANDSALLARRSIINRQPGVVFVAMVMIGQPSGRRPDDGANWRKTNWTFDRNASDSMNWAFEDVNLPLVWGCQTGMTNPGLGLIEARIPGSGDSRSTRVLSSPHRVRSTRRNAFKMHTESGSPAS